MLIYLLTKATRSINWSSLAFLHASIVTDKVQVKSCTQFVFTFEAVT